MTKNVLDATQYFDNEWAMHIRWVNITALIAVLLLLLVMKAVMEQPKA